MLSRVAERLYWLARYMERAENVARLLSVYSNFLLDLPKGSHVSWETLIVITGNETAFDEIFDTADEGHVADFLIAEKTSPGSILNIITMARENARTTREILPAEAWELINDVYLYVKEHADQSVGRVQRQDFLKRVINASQQLTGLLTGCMSHNSAYDFMVMGRNIERADMTGRIVDVGAATLMEKSVDVPVIIPYENALWMNVLRSLNGYQMYRQHVQEKVNGDDVVAYLLLDKEFPRAVLHCLFRLTAAAKKLPNNEHCLRTVASTLRKVQDVNVSELLDTNKLYDFIDDLEQEYAAIHDEISKSWFLRHDETPAAVSSRST